MKRVPLALVAVFLLSCALLSPAYARSTFKVIQLQEAVVENRLVAPPGSAQFSITDLGGTTSQATAINAGGQVVGSSANATGPTHAFLWEKGVMTDLGTLGGTFTAAGAIDNSGQIVGSSAIAAGPFHAVLWTK